MRNQPNPAERLLWRALSRGQMNGFRFNRQMPVGPYFADFLCRSARLVVEVDGWSHETRQERDKQRDSFMISQGFTVLRFTNADVTTNLEGVVHRIAMALAKLRPKEKCPPPTPPTSGRGEDSAAQNLLGISLEGSVG